MEGVETVLTAVEIATEIYNAFDKDGDGQIIPKEVIDVLVTLGNGQAGDNDVEALLTDIKASLMYDEENTALYEISSRLEVIDTRLDKEFQAINKGLGIIIVGLITIVVWKFFAWIMRLVSV